jgi:glycosyltransferase involved in cell wall biosynthesis
MIAEKTATSAIYVSSFLLLKDKLKGGDCHLVYNALSEKFIIKSNMHSFKYNGKMNVLMLSSLKEYKGVFEFIKLAAILPSVSFELVINASSEKINDFFNSFEMSENIKIYPSQSDVHPFYEKANLVLNLSHPLKWIETFGMTILEAMAYSIPVIVPPVGGITELVETGFNGYKIDVRDLNSIAQVINELSVDNELLFKLSKSASVKAKSFVPASMNSQILQILTK